VSPERKTFDAVHQLRAPYGSPAYKAWENWVQVHGFPVAQVAVNGWVERDPDACTVSARVFAWQPGEEEEFTASATERTRAYPNRKGGVIAYSYGAYTLTYDDTGDARDAWMGTLTIKLDRPPLPFPEVSDERT
jgi:hypothetical protein